MEHSHNSSIWRNKIGAINLNWNFSGGFGGFFYSLWWILWWVGWFFVEFSVIEFGKWLLKKIKFVGSNPRIICVFSILWFIYFLISYFPFFITKMWFLKIPIFLSKIPQLFMKKKNIPISDSKQMKQFIKQVSFHINQLNIMQTEKRWTRTNVKNFIFLDLWKCLNENSGVNELQSNRVWFSVLLGMKFLEWLGSNPAENCIIDN
jgi:hypothetical protein